MPLANFDGPWCIIWKLLTEKGDRVASDPYINNHPMIASAVQQ